MLPGNIFNRHEDVNVREIEHAASLGASASSYRAPSGYQRCRLRYVIKTIASTHTPTVNIVTVTAQAKSSSAQRSTSLFLGGLFFLLSFGRILGPSSPMVVTRLTALNKPGAC